MINRIINVGESGIFIKFDKDGHEISRSLETIIIVNKKAKQCMLSNYEVMNYTSYKFDHDYNEVIFSDTDDIFVLDIDINDDYEIKF